MFKCISLLIKREKPYILWNVLLCSSILFSLFFAISNGYRGKEAQRTLFSSYPLGASYISDMFGELFQEAQLQEESLNDKVGYAKLDHTNCIDEKSVVTIYMNEYLSKFEYELKAGEWLCDSESSSVILGGMLGEQYEVGDTIVIDKKDGTRYQAVVRGILPNNYKLMLVNCSGEDMDFNTIASSNLGDIVITLDNKLISESIRVNKQAFVVDKTYLDRMDQGIKDAIHIKSFEAMENASELAITKVELLLLMMTSLSCVIYGIYLESKKSRDRLQVLYQLGTSIQTLSLYVLIPQMMYYIVSLVLVICYHLIGMEPMDKWMIGNSVRSISLLSVVIFGIAYSIIFLYLRCCWTRVERNLE